MIKESYKRVGNEYITVPTIQTFCKKNNINYDSSTNRVDGLNLIEKFGAENKENKLIVDKWIDTTIKAGRKHIYIASISFNNAKGLYKTDSFWDEFIHSNNLNKEYIGINNITSDNNLKCRKIDLFKENGKVDRVSLYLSQFVYDANANCKEEYPIFIDIYIEKQIFIARIKSKSKLYKLKDDFDETKPIDENFDVRSTVKADSMVALALAEVGLLLNFNRTDIKEFKEKIKSIYFDVFKDLTATPVEIQTDLDTSKSKIHVLADGLLDILGIDKNVYGKEAKSDLMSLAEKYKAISYPDKTIFTKDKFAYPIKLIATDSEDTKLEGTASNLEPFQTKSAFYDYKKNIMDQKSCETIELAVHRKNTLYFPKKPFILLLETKSKFSKLRIDEYISEEEIENVLSRIIANM